MADGSYLRWGNALGERSALVPNPGAAAASSEAGAERTSGPSERRRCQLCWPAWTRSLPFHLLLLLLTACTTTLVGAQIAANYARQRPLFDLALTLSWPADWLRHPALLLKAALAGLPFSLTLLAILLAHELGHYMACRHYGIRATYPYFLPAPTLIGTLGAFIRIRSPLTSRRQLFDVGVAGPLAGFAAALPALVWGTLGSRAAAVGVPANTITLGRPLALALITRWLRPDLQGREVLLSPVGCAAWVGLFATALNLLPMGQLDGGHILYACWGDRHRAISRSAFAALLPLGIFCWAGWIVWGVVLLIIGLRHPSFAAASPPLDRGRKCLAALAAVVLILSFTPTPFTVH
jgi:hypothetical protein